MRVRFKKPVVSIFGTFEPGMVIDMPNPKIVASWLKNGIAGEVKGHAHGVVVRAIAPAPAKNKNSRAASSKRGR